MFVKLAFSVAAHLDAEIMIMDEVLAVGDMAFQTKCLDKMREAANKDGRTVLYVSHNMNTIRKLCERCIVLDKGKVKYDGRVEEAIALYSGINESGLQSVYSMENVVRPSSRHGSKIFIKEFAFLNGNDAVFEREKPIRFMIKYKAYESIKRLKLYLTIQSVNGVFIGTTQTYNSFADVNKDDVLTNYFSLDISNISAGRYSFQLDVFSDDGEGHHLSYDHPSCNIFFEITDNHPRGIIWQPQYFGAVILNPIKLES